MSTFLKNLSSSTLGFSNKKHGSLPFPQLSKKEISPFIIGVCDEDTGNWTVWKKDCAVVIVSKPPVFPQPWKISISRGAPYVKFMDQSTANLHPDDCMDVIIDETDYKVCLYPFVFTLKKRFGAINVLGFLGRRRGESVCVAVHPFEMSSEFDSAIVDYRNVWDEYDPGPGYGPTVSLIEKKAWKSIEINDLISNFEAHYGVRFGELPAEVQDHEMVTYILGRKEKEHLEMEEKLKELNKSKEYVGDAPKFKIDEKVEAPVLKKFKPAEVEVKIVLLESHPSR